MIIEMVLWKKIQVFHIVNESVIKHSNENIN